MTKSYKEMIYPELIGEIERVEILLISNKKPFTQRQNRKYLNKLKVEAKEYERFMNNAKN